jgi:hypothetical protein
LVGGHPRDEVARPTYPDGENRGASRRAASPRGRDTIVSDQLLSYPTDRVVGVAPDRPTLDRVRTALDEADVASDRVEVWCSDDTARDLDPDDADGPLDGIVQTVQKALGEETKRLERLSDAIDRGGYVVAVELEDPEDNAARHEVGRVLHDAGATSVAFYGQWAIEELQFGA